MKRIYTYGHQHVERNITIADIIANKENKVNMTQVTAQNREEAEILSDQNIDMIITGSDTCLLYTSPSPRDSSKSRMPSSA